MNKEELIGRLSGIIYPETGANIAESGILESCEVAENKIVITLNFPKQHDPFVKSVKRQVQELLTSHYPEYVDKVSIIVKEAAPKKVEKQPVKSQTASVKNIIAIASGKGGVGKSTVTTNLAVTMAAMGLRVGVLDADIYGPSQAKMFGVEGYVPDAEVAPDGIELILPAEAYGVKIMSIAFFISDNDALIWRGPMATNALRQLIHQTKWGELDFLLIDMPPGTGDIHLGILQELKLDGAVIVSTPQEVALADVVRGIKMFEAPKIEVPVFGIIENMAWFTPEELPDNRYYIFGKGGAQRLAQESGVELLGEIPIIQSVMEGADSGKPASLQNESIKKYYSEIVNKIVEKGK